MRSNFKKLDSFTLEASEKQPHPQPFAQRPPEGSIKYFILTLIWIQVYLVVSLVFYKVPANASIKKCMKFSVEIYCHLDRAHIFYGCDQIKRFSINWFCRIGSNIDSDIIFIYTSLLLFFVKPVWAWVGQTSTPIFKTALKLFHIDTEWLRSRDSKS